jgi:hypothetical protein
MKYHGVPNIKSDREQLPKLIPSTSAMRTFDALAKKLGTSREEIGRNIGSKGETLIWAFTRGKSPRAEELRTQAIAELDRMIEQEMAVAA